MLANCWDSSSNKDAFIGSVTLAASWTLRLQLSISWTLRLQLYHDPAICHQTAACKGSDGHNREYRWWDLSGKKCNKSGHNVAVIAIIGLG
ncbi:unnamed protein product [Rhizophagus irregularis]|nr:unnamed protein product [Rhizophagus irregularis]